MKQLVKLQATLYTVQPAGRIHSVNTCRSYVVRKTFAAHSALGAYTYKWIHLRRAPLTFYNLFFVVVRRHPYIPNLKEGLFLAHSTPIHHS